MTIVPGPEQSTDSAVDDAADFLADVVLGGCALVAVLAGLGLWVVLA